MKYQTNFKVMGRTLLIELNSELDHHNSEFIRKKADNIIDANVIKNIILDFDKVSFMDSSGIGVIMGRYKKIIFNKGKIVVININKSIDRILRMSGLYRLVERCDDLDMAIDKLEERVK